MIPPLMLESLIAYRDHGRPTGGCLRCILANDLMGAFKRADEQTTAGMKDIVGFLYNEMPILSHGSYDKVDEWILSKGRR